MINTVTQEVSVIIGRDKYISVLFFKCELGAVMKRGINLVPNLRAEMPQRSFSVFGVGHLPKMCTLSCTARCMTVYLIYRGEKVVEVARKIARVKFVHDFT